MKVNQIYELVNTINKEITGITTVVSEDLSNIVDLGNELQNLDLMDNYVKKLVDQIGKMVFVNRAYEGSAPKVLMDAWEFGAILEKVTVEMPEASENPMWKLQNGETYNQDVFYSPDVSVKFYNKRVTFQIKMSFVPEQMKSAFKNVEEMNSFVSMIYTAINNRFTLTTDELIMRTINNMIGETLHAEFPDGSYGNDSKTKAVNLLHLYNAKFPTANLKSENCLNDKEFIRFASMTIAMYEKRMNKMSTLFNIGKKNRFTPNERLYAVMLNDFVSAAGAYLQSDTYHDQYTALPNADTVAYWQGSGQSYEFGEVSEIHINTSSGEEVVASGILGVMFDRDALGVTNLDRITTSHVNADGMFTNYFYKFVSGYFNDTNENFVVFYVADAE